MKILVMSDSHGKTKNVHEVILKENDVDAIIHLGDMYRDYLEIKDCYEIPSYGVIGNIDYETTGSTFELLDIDGFKVFICHGHNYRVKSTLEIVKHKARSLYADIILFGHSHVSYLERGNIFIMNPGSISDPRTEMYPSYGILYVEDNKIDGEIVFLDKI